MEIFRKLGERVDRLWAERNYDERTFPEICTDVLRSDADIAKVSALDILSWIGAQLTLPAQHEPVTRFSDLSVTFYDSPRFDVGALFWLDGTTAVHQHSFSGAFKVLLGSSLQCRYRFEESRQVNQALRLGSLVHEKAEVVPTGMVCPITSGDGFIHSLFHLDRPSVTLVVRTKTDVGTAPQWSYLAPGIAFDPFHVDPVVQKKLEAISALLVLPATEADVQLREILQSADLLLTYRLLDLLNAKLWPDPLERMMDLKISKPRFERLVAISRKRHGSVIDDFLCAFEEARRQYQIRRIRGTFTDPESRHFLALLLNLPGREWVLKLLQERHSDRDPVEVFLEHITAFGSTRELGASNNILGISDFDQEHLILLEAILRGSTPAEATEALVEKLSDEEEESVRELALKIIADLEGSDLLQSAIQR